MSPVPRINPRVPSEIADPERLAARQPVPAEGANRRIAPRIKPADTETAIGRSAPIAPKQSVDAIGPDSTVMPSAEVQSHQHRDSIKALTECLSPEMSFTSPVWGEHSVTYMQAAQKFMIKKCLEQPKENQQPYLDAIRCINEDVLRRQRLQQMFESPVEKDIADKSVPQVAAAA